MKQFDFNQRKFQELTLCLSERSRHDRHFGNIKLNKLLYYADFNAYRLLGQPITGAEYRKYLEGPAPARMPEQRRIMLDAGLIRIEDKRTITGSRQRTVALRPSETGLFTPEQLIVIGEALQGLNGLSERESAKLSQEEIGWKAARPGETIPYETAWLSPEPLSQEAEEWYRQKAAAPAPATTAS